MPPESTADLSRYDDVRARRQTAAWMAERVEAVLPGPDLAVRTRAAFAWQDEVLARLR
jgi:hypothetical protein